MAENLGIEYRVIPIEDIFVEYLKIFNGQQATVGDVAEENIQARIGEACGCSLPTGKTG